ncbi:retinoschisin-like [Asterias amurensis]|uniref:retinoschisin-like n=1 Tax=Asterias amurensis TaxID=7602 RepID=UPI003AB3FF08
MESGEIQDKQITASSINGDNQRYAPKNGRLNSPVAWAPKDNVEMPWIQVDFDGMVTVTGVITQGSAGSSNWVTEFSILINDGESWNYILDPNGSVKKFSGNSDRSTQVTTRFEHSHNAMLLRIIPKNRNMAPHCMRFEVLGCPAV